MKNIRALWFKPWPRTLKTHKKKTKKNEIEICEFEMPKGQVWKRVWILKVWSENGSQNDIFGPK